MSNDSPSTTRRSEIRVAGPGDADTLAEFNRAMALETEGRALDARTVRCGVDRVVGDPSHGFYLLASREGRIAGSLMVTYEWSDWRDGQFWWIQSVYVRPEHRRRGVYRDLYDRLRERAQEHMMCADFGSTWMAATRRRNQPMPDSACGRQTTCCSRMGSSPDPCPPRWRNRTSYPIQSPPGFDYPYHGATGSRCFAQANRDKTS